MALPGQLLAESVDERFGSWPETTNASCTTLQRFATVVDTPRELSCAVSALKSGPRFSRTDRRLASGAAARRTPHYFASLLIASGADVKVVQSRLRHASATTTLNTYAHLWSDSDEATRSAVGAVLVARADSLRLRR